jgi:hypothetical protein
VPNTERSKTLPLREQHRDCLSCGPARPAHPPSRRLGDRVVKPSVRSRPARRRTRRRRQAAAPTPPSARSCCPRASTPRARALGPTPQGTAASAEAGRRAARPPGGGGRRDLRMGAQALYTLTRADFDHYYREGRAAPRMRPPARRAARGRRPGAPPRAAAARRARRRRVEPRASPAPRPVPPPPARSPRAGLYCNASGAPRGRGGGGGLSPRGGRAAAGEPEIPRGAARGRMARRIGVWSARPPPPPAESPRAPPRGWR